MQGKGFMSTNKVLHSSAKQKYQEQILSTKIKIIEERGLNQIFMILSKYTFNRWFVHNFI